MSCRRFEAAACEGSTSPSEAERPSMRAAPPAEEIRTAPVELRMSGGPRKTPTVRSLRPMGHNRQAGSVFSSRRRRAWMLVAVLLLLTGAGVWVWLAAATIQLGHVEVIVDAAPLECAGAELALHQPAGERGPRTPTTTITEDMRCILRFHVTNRGSGTVIIEQVTIPGLGPTAGDGAVARLMLTGAVEPTAGRTAAVFEVDRPLQGSSTEPFEVEVTYREDGCTLPKGGIFPDDAPQVDVRALGLSGTRSAVGHRFGFLGSQDTAC